MEFLAPLYAADGVVAGKDAESWNEYLHGCIVKKDVASLTSIYIGYIKELPSYDPEMLVNISDEEAPQRFVTLYPLYVAATEAARILDEDSTDMKVFRENLTEDARNRLRQLAKDSIFFHNLKVQCEKILNPLYPYIDMDLITSKEKYIGPLTDYIEGKTHLLESMQEQWHHDRMVEKEVEIRQKKSDLQIKEGYLKNISKTMSKMSEEKPGDKALFESLKKAKAKVEAKILVLKEEIPVLEEELKGLKNDLEVPKNDVELNEFKKLKEEIKNENVENFKNHLRSILSMLDDNVTQKNHVKLVKRSMDILLNDAGIDPDKVVIQDFDGKNYSFGEGRKDYLTGMSSSEPRFFTYGENKEKKMKIYILSKGFPKEISKEQAIKIFSKRVNDAAKKAGELLNSEIATPWYIRWLTGSDAYQRMQEAFAAYKNVTVNGSETDIESVASSTARKALMDLGSAAKDYFNRKGVSLDTYSSFADFKTSQRYSTMNPAEKARMKAAYSAYAAYKVAKSETYKNLIDDNALVTPVAPVALDDNSYKVRVSYANAFIWYDPLFKKSEAPSNDSNVERELQEELKEVLFAFEPGSEPSSKPRSLLNENDGKFNGSLLNKQFNTNLTGGLLSRKCFTDEDCIRVKEVFAKAVILHLIKNERECNLVGMKALYKNSMLDVEMGVLRSDIFKKNVDGYLTPDGLRRFFTDGCHGRIAREIVEHVKKRKKEKSLSDASQKQSEEPDVDRLKPFEELELKFGVPSGTECSKSF